MLLEKLQEAQKINHKKRFVNLVKSVASNMTDITKNLASSVFGDEIHIKKEGKKKKIVDEMDDPLFFNNPIMKGLITVRNQLDQIVVDNKTQECKNEVMIKEQICDLLSFLENLRQDFLISNILAWFIENITKKKLTINDSSIESKIAKIIDKQLKTVLPKIVKTGIQEIDERNQNKLDSPLLNSKVKGKSKKGNFIFQEFTNYTEIPEIDDLDSFVRGSSSHDQGNLKSADNNSFVGIFPSLLMTFLLTQEFKLQDKILSVMVRCFNQRSEMAENLQKLQILFDEADIEAFVKIKLLATKLRYITEKTEVF